jgi:oxygen-independent coproporphyrinogen-3 oxidase
MSPGPPVPDTAGHEIASGLLDRDEQVDAPGLYVHIPFCEAKCSYCDFYSVARGDAPAHRYAAALQAEIKKRVTSTLEPATVLVGGGTPTALDDAQFERTLELIAEIALPSGRLREWSVECNPGSLTPEKARLMVDAGVTRASIGVQSFDDDVLRSVGRVHDAREAREAIAIARDAGLAQISLDLLFAIPGQGPETFRHDLNEAVRLGTDHVSAYALLYESGTALTRKRERGLVEAEDESIELTMMREARRVLVDAGLAAYEVSNFARPAAECLHNLNYWRNGPYIGLGPSAVSYWNGERRGNVADWRSWQERVLRGDDPVATSERLPPSTAAREELMLRLRLAEGASLAAVEARWGTDLRGPLRELLLRLRDAGLLEADADLDRVTFTERGFEVADGMLAEILATP